MGDGRLDCSVGERGGLGGGECWEGWWGCSVGKVMDQDSDSQCHQVQLIVVWTPTPDSATGNVFLDAESTA
jgi:hypothetical protein